MLRKSSAALLSIAILLSAGYASPARAAKGNDVDSLLGIGSGIASPSPVFDGNPYGSANPSGMALNAQTKIQLTGSTNENDLNPLGYTGGVFFGNGSVGGGVFYAGSTAAGASGSLNAGIGFEIRSLKSSFGASCSTALSGGISISCNRFGYGYDQDGKFRLGASVTTGGPSVGVDAGVGFQLGKEFVLVVDGALPLASGNTVRLAPALGYVGRSVQLMGGYGFELGSGTVPGTTSVLDEFFAGMGFVLGRSAHLALYYQRHATYAVSLTFRL